MIHYLQYQAYIAKDGDVAVLNLDKKWFQDWFNVFDLYNIATINYNTTIRIPYTSDKFTRDYIGKFYVTGVFVQQNVVNLQLLFLQSENPWLNKDSQMLGSVTINGKTDYLMTLYIPIAYVKQDQNNYSQALSYVCNTFTQCVNQQFYLGV